MISLAAVVLTCNAGGLSFARCEYGMVPLGTGVANCLGEEWSEVLLGTTADNRDDF